MSDERPESVPDDWICAPCKMCERPTWYPPGAEAAASAQAVAFIVACSPACVLKSVKFWERVKAAAGKP